MKRALEPSDSADADSDHESQLNSVFSSESAPSVAIHEVVDYVLAWLDPVSCLAAAITCKHWAEAATSPLLWKSHVINALFGAWSRAVPSRRGAIA